MINNNPKISVIVPVYNAERYLHRCIDSILAQTFTDFEVLLIDDGSKDKSGEICDEYAKKDIRVKVFHKENGGVSSARQYGVDHAAGEFSIHIDPDDWINKEMLLEMYNKAISDNTDFVIADFFRDTISEKNVYDRQTIQELESQSILRQILRYSIYGCLWNKLVRTNLYSKYKTHFIEGINYGEDVLLLCQVLQHSFRISKINKAFYHYTNDNEYSITRKYNIETYKYRKRYIKALDKLLSSKFKDDLRFAAFNIVSEAFNNAVVAISDMRAFYPIPLHKFLFMTMPKSVKVAFICANLRLDFLVIYLAKRYNKGVKINILR